MARTSTQQLTIEEVMNPSSIQFGATVLDLALKKQFDAAQEQHVELAGRILAETQRVKARLQQRLQDLAEAASEVQKSVARIDRAQELVSTSKGLLPLAAEVDMKQDVIDFARANGLVVPSSKSEKWNLKDAADATDTQE